MGPETLSLDAASLPARDFTYFDERYRFKFPVDYRKPMIGPIVPVTYLTASGVELMRIAGAKKLMGYAEAVLKDLAIRLKLDFERISERNE